MAIQNALPSRPAYRHVPVEDLEFDSNNPRLGGSATGLNQNAIQELLEQIPHYATELVPSFVENEFIAYEPLVVRQKGSKFVVIEGNRRLAAVKHILAHPDEFSQTVRDQFATAEVNVCLHRPFRPNYGLLR